MFWNTTFLWIANASAIVGLITAAITGIAWWRLRADRRKIKDQLNVLAHQSQGEPVAIAVGVGPTVGDISGVVRKYLERQGMSMQLFNIFHPEEVNEANAYEIRDELLELRRRLNAVGLTKIHFFCGAPVALGVVFGAVLDNWVPTIIYTRDLHDSEKLYKPLMTLDKFSQYPPSGKK